MRHYFLVRRWQSDVPWGCKVGWLQQLRHLDGSRSDKSDDETRRTSSRHTCGQILNPPTPLKQTQHCNIQCGWRQARGCLCDGHHDDGGETLLQRALLEALVPLQPLWTGGVWSDLSTGGRDRGYANFIAAFSERKKRGTVTRHRDAKSHTLCERPWTEYFRNLLQRRGCRWLVAHLRGFTQAPLWRRIWRLTESTRRLTTEK